MPDFSMKRGDSLEELEVQLFDRDQEPMNLTDASRVAIYIEVYGNTMPEVADGQCVILPAGTEAYPSRIRGPDVTMDDAGSFQAYFKVTYPTGPKRVPSDGYLSIAVGKNFE